MNMHKLARLTPFGREVLVQRVRAGVPVATVARETGVSRQTVYNVVALGRRRRARRPAGPQVDPASLAAAPRPTSLANAGYTKYITRIRPD